VGVGNFSSSASGASNSNFPRESGHVEGVPWGPTRE
jgi:hypothetical protein